VDEPRLLALRSEFGYVDRTIGAMADEPEAVSEAEQRVMTQGAAALADLLRRQTWIEARDGIRASLALLDLAVFSDVSRDLRAIDRLVERLDARL